MESKFVTEVFNIEGKFRSLIDEAEEILDGDSNNINGLKRDMQDKLLSI